MPEDIAIHLLNEQPNEFPIRHRIPQTVGG
jgi:hypothetical protein